MPASPGQHPALDVLTGALTAILARKRPYVRVHFGEELGPIAAFVGFTKSRSAKSLSTFVVLLRCIVLYMLPQSMITMLDDVIMLTEA